MNKTQFSFFPTIASLILLLFHDPLIFPHVEAATLLVPDDYPSVNFAMDASSDGDTIRITDSGVYNENLVISKAINLEADTGQNPVIQGTGTTSSVIWSDNRSLGARIGSLDGGQIVIDGGGFDTVSVILGNGHDGAGTVLYENLLIRNPHADKSMIFPSAAGNTTYRNIEIDAGNVCQFPIRLDFLGGKQLTFEGCSLSNAPDIGFFCGNPTGSGTVDIIDCNIESAQRPVLIQPTSGPFTFNIERSWIRNTDTAQSWQTISLRGDATVFNATESVIENQGPGNAFLFFPGVGNLDLILDHCDIIASGVAFFFEGASNRSFTITNSNIVSGSVGFGGALDPGDVFTVNNNNVPGGYNSFPTGSSDVIPGQAPDYLNPGLGDFRYSTTALLMADADGGPIGVNNDFDFMIMPTATPTLTPTPDPNVTPTPTPLYSPADQSYIDAFHAVFPQRIPPYTLEEYLEAFPFDRYLNRPSLESAIVLMEAGDLFPFNFATWMQGFNEMYLHTGNLAYIRENLYLIRRILNYRDDVQGLTLFDGTINPVWGETGYSTDGREYFAVDDGGVIYPMYWLLEIARDHPDAMAEFDAGEWDSMLAFLDETLEFHKAQYREGPAPGEGRLIFLRTDLSGFVNQPQPVNWMSSIGKAYWLSWKLSGNAEYRDIAIAMAQYAKNRISLATDGAYYWAYWLPLNPVPTAPVPRETITGLPGYSSIEDISHAALSASFWIYMAEEGQVFTQQDMERFGQTIQLGIARLDNGILFPGLLGIPDNSQASRVLSSSVEQFIRLAQFDPEVYERMSDFYLTYWSSPGPRLTGLLLRYHPSVIGLPAANVSHWEIY